MPTLSRRIRKHERAFYYVITAVIAVSFFFWGTADFSDPKTREVLGTVAGKPVTRLELASMTERAEVLALLDAFSRSQNPRLSSPYARFQWMAALSEVRKNLRNPQTRNLFQMYLGLGDLGDLSRNDVRENQAWKWLAYVRAAEGAGLGVSAEETAQFVRAINGAPDASRPFHAEDYQRRVADLGLTVELFEKALSDFLLVEKYFDAIGEAAHVTSQEILDAYLQENREVELAWIGFKPEDFAGRVQPPARDAVARYFQEHKGGPEFKLPAKVQVEYLLAEREKFLPSIEAPSEADIKTRYDVLKDRDYKNPDGGKDGKPPHKPIEEVREGIVQDLRKERASLKAAEALQKALLDIGAVEAKIRLDPSVKVDFEDLAKRFGVTYGLSHFFSETQVDDAEKLFGAFREPRDRDAFRRKIFKDMKPGEVMRGESRPLATDKGALIYRLVQRKEERVPDQFTGEAEQEIVAKLRREATDKLAVEEARRVRDRIDAVGPARAEEELRVTLNRPPALKEHQPLPDPSGEHGGTHPDGHLILERAIAMRQANQVGKADLVDPGAAQTKYVVVLLRALEAKMDDFESQKARIREQLLEEGGRAGGGVPGKRRQLVDAKRAELEQGIQRAKPEQKDSPAPSPAGKRPGRR